MTSVRYQRPLSPYGRAWLCAQLGWRVFPVRAETKVPAIKRWPDRATTSASQIAEWYQHTHVGCDVGVLTGSDSGIWVLDIDVKWTNGLVSVRDLFARHGEAEVPDTFRVSTPSGGQQWYFTYPDDGRKVSNATSEPSHPGRLGPGLEVRGWHGQVVAPGSQGREVLHDTLPPREAPVWLLDLVTARTEVRTPRERYGASVTSEAAQRALSVAADRLALVGNGGRNAALNHAAFALGGLASVAPLREAEVRDALQRACLTNGMLLEDNGEAEFNATFDSGWNAGLKTGEDR